MRLMNKDLTLGHFGAGPIHLDGWLNFDIDRSHTHCEQHGDVLRTHFDENKFDVIFSTHMLEHLSFPVDTIECLNRFSRWLKPGGILRLAVPDLELAVKAYYEKRSLHFLYGKDFKAYYHKDSPCERLNFFIRAWEHQICFDYELLSSLLADAGFQNIQKKQPNESAIPGFNFDRFISESLYVEAIK